MPENIRYSTLCSTCKNVENCITLKLSDGPIYFCEDFCIDIFHVVGNFFNTGDIDILPITNHNVGEEEHIRSPNNRNVITSTKYFGLCINCDNRHNCSLSNSEGGVWHCEEYR